VKLPRILALSPGNLDEGNVPAFLDRVDQALEGGLRAILFREPRLGDGAWLAAFEQLRGRAPRETIWLGAHDRVHLGVLAGADAVHLGFRSLPIARARELVGGEMAIGLSTHAGDDIAKWEEADYLFHGPVRPTPSKVGLKDPIGIEGLTAAVASTPLPLFALGGMRPEDVAGALEAGAHGVAVLSGILGAGSPEECRRAAGRYLEAAAEAAPDGEDNAT
jgi:thiamine-phosphate pyrophosphorylase